MSRGPGRLQRAIIDVLEDADPPPRVDKRYWPRQNTTAGGQADGQADHELTTHHVTSRMSEQGWWWDDTLDRQVRRALDSLHRRGVVTKRMVPNTPDYPNAMRAVWSLVREP